MLESLLIKLHVSGLVTLLKKDSNTGVFQRNLCNFKNTFCRITPVDASDLFQTSMAKPQVSVIGTLNQLRVKLQLKSHNLSTSEELLGGSHNNFPRFLVISRKKFNSATCDC